MTTACGQNSFNVLDPHLANIITGSNKCFYSATNSDLNPIEHVWDVLGKSVRNMDPSPQTAAQLADALVQSGGNLGQRRLVGSMHSRIAAVLAARGDHTRY